MQTKTIQEELCSLSLERGSQQHLSVLSIGSQHFPLYWRSSWEFSYPCCLSQRILPSSALQTPLSLSGDN